MGNNVKMTGADYLAIVKSKVDFDHPAYTPAEAWQRVATCATDDLALVKLRLDSAVEELKKTEHSQCFIVLDDYADPITNKYRGYSNIAEAFEEAKNRLRRILEQEEIMEKFQELSQVLKDEHEVLIEKVSGGWQGDMAFIKIATVSK
jgi:hypothetical protein